MTTVRSENVGLKLSEGACLAAGLAHVPRDARNREELMRRVVIDVTGLTHGYGQLPALL